MKRSFAGMGVFAATFLVACGLSAELNWETLIQKSTQCSKESIVKSLRQNLQTIPQGTQEQPNARARKDWNFMVYFAANNNLNSFALENIRQMVKVGSSATINVLIQLDELGAKEITRFYIQKNKAVAVSTQAGTQECISGTKESLFDFSRWAIKNYPADHQCLILWNHGSGIKDPSIWGKILLSHRDELFVFNEKTGLLELNRKLMRQRPKQLEDLFTKLPVDPRGIAFNDTFATYLTNQDLKITLEKICKELLNGQKFDLICMDACHMEMLEVGSQIKNTAKFMVGSEEVEPGAGYDYRLVLTPFENNTLSPENFAKHIVNAYRAQYHPTHADYTQSAIDLEKLPLLEQNFTQLSGILMELASGTQGDICLKIIKEIRSKSTTTTEFNDPDYIDLGHFYKSLYTSLNNTRGESNKNWQILTKRTNTLQTLKSKVSQGIAILSSVMVANTAGSALGQATGLAFYFPVRVVHNSYYKTVFDQSTKWSSFLNKFTKVRRESRKAV